MKNRFKKWLIKFFNLELDQIKETEKLVVYDFKTTQPLHFKFDREVPKEFSIIEATDKAKKELVQLLLQESSAFNVTVKHNSHTNYNTLNVDLMVYKYE